MRKIFHDPHLQKEFDEKGFVFVPLLSESEVAEVWQLYTDLKKEFGEVSSKEDQTYELSFFDNKPSFKQALFNRISAYFQPKVDQLLDRYVPLITNIFVKEPGKGEVPVHQNWTFVDEKEFTSVSVWCPLVDASRENGALEAVPRSHKVISDYRSPSIPWAFQDLFEPLKEKYMKPFELKAGYAAILDDSILHFSSDNHTDKPRPAVQLIMHPAEAPAIHYYREGNADELEVLEVTPDFFFDFNMNEKPTKGESVGKIPYRHVNLSEEDLRQRIGLS